MRPALWLAKFLIEKDKLPIVQLLDKSDLLSHVSAWNILAMVRKAHHRKFKSGETIITEGELAKSFFIIEEGSVRIFTVNAEGKEIALARLERGAYFGEQALLELQSGRRNASAIAITDVNVFEITYEDFVPVITSDKKIKEELTLAGKKQRAIKIFKKFAIFAKTKNTILASLTGDLVEYSDKQVIFQKGDLSNYAYYILSGKVDIFFENKNTISSTTSLAENTLFGELGILNKQARQGTAVANGPVKLFAIPAESFNKLYASNKKLRDFIGALQQVYISSARGVVTITQGSLLGKKTINTTFKLIDGRIAIASRVIGQAIFDLKIQDVIPTEKLSYHHGNENREILLLNEKIIGVTCQGYWEDLGYMCSLILEGTPIEPWYLNLFKETGNIAINAKTRGDIICYCMRVTRGMIIEAIQGGCNDLKSLMQKTSAGTICGVCQSNIQTLLGKENWFLVYIHKVISLSKDIRLYQLKPYYTKLPLPKPGQFIVLQGLVDNNWIERSYTLTSISSDYYEIVVKREPQGIFSNWLFDNDKENLFLRVSSPQGQFIFDSMSHKSAMFFAAGIGVTPAIAFARELAAKNSVRQLYIHYSAHSRDVMIFIDELANVKLKNFNFLPRVTQTEGRLTEQQMKEWILLLSADEFFICGPPEYENWIVSVLHKLGVPEKNIKIERFTATGGRCVNS